MARLRQWGMLLLLGALLAGCAKSYRIEVDAALVPEEIAKEMRSRRLHEGRNQLVDFGTHRLFADIEKGRFKSMRLEIQDQPPRNIDLTPHSALTSPAPPTGGELPQSCDKRFSSCKQACGSLPSQGRRCCELECFADWVTCRYRPPNEPGDLGFRIF
jgi:hypothetical protein